MAGRWDGGGEHVERKPSASPLLELHVAEGVQHGRVGVLGSDTAMSEQVKRLFVVSFVMRADEEKVKFFHTPDEQWIKDMVAGPGSIWTLDCMRVEEITDESL